MLAAYKKLIAGENAMVPGSGGPWVKPSLAGRGRWTLTGLEKFYPAIAAVRLGANADAFDTVLPINTGDPVTLPDVQKRLQYIVKDAPGVPGDVLFAQFEYVDGTRGACRQFNAATMAQAPGRSVPPRAQPAPALPPGVLELKVTGQPGPTPPPRAFETFRDGKTTVSL